MSSVASWSSTGAASSSKSRKKRNAFTFFLFEQAKEADESQAAFQERVGRTWEKMNAQQRNKYVDMAKSWNGCLGKGGGDATSTSLPSSTQGGDAFSAKDPTTAARRVERLVRVYADAEILHLAEFVILDFNAVCCTVSGGHLPAEVAAVRFSLEKGVVSCYHAFVDAHGRLPLGCRREAIRNAEDTHALPPEDFVLSRKDVAQVVEELRVFSQGGRPVFCREAAADRVEGCLAAMASAGKGHNFEMLSLEKLAVELTKLTSGKSVLPLPSVTSAETVLEADPFEFTSSAIGCRFHEALGDVARHCCLSRCARAAYGVLSRLCLGAGDANVSVGSHEPPGGTARPHWYERGHPQEYDDERLGQALRQALVKEFVSPFGAEMIASGVRNGHTAIPTHCDPAEAFRLARETADRSCQAENLDVSLASLSVSGNAPSQSRHDASGMTTAAAALETTRDTLDCSFRSESSRFLSPETTFDRSIT